MADGKVREWIGPRIIPVFADEVEWDITSTYEPLIMVQHEGETFMSRQYVPAGIQLPNTSGDEESNDYWVHMSNWNAQVEYYRQEVLAFDGRIDTLEDDLPTSSFDSTNTVAKAIDDAKDLLPATSFDSTNTVAKAIQDAKDLLPATAFDSVNTVDERFNTVNSTIGDLADLLPANAFSSVNTVDARFDSIEASRTKIGVIGDSFSNANDEWPNILGNAIGKTVINKSTSATGFTIGAPNTFQQQLSSLINDNDMEEFSHIIVYGGINDWRVQHSTVSQMETAFQVFLSTYNSISGIKPKLIFAFGNVGNTTISEYNNYKSWYLGCIDALQNMNMPGIVLYVPYWLMGVSSAIGSDDLHPTSKGELYIANFMEQIVNGTYTGVNRKIPITLDFSGISNISDVSVTTAPYAVLTNDILSIHGSVTFKITGDLSTQQPFGTMETRVGFGNNSSDSTNLQTKIVDIRTNGTSPVNSIIFAQIKSNPNISNIFYIETIGSFVSSWTIWNATLDFVANI